MKKEQCSDNKNSNAAGARSQSTVRALQVLIMMAEEGQDLGIREIARRLKVSSSIVQRYVSTLVECGFVERAEDGQKYRIGYRAFQVGQAYVARSNLQQVCQPELRHIAEKDQINVYLGVLRDRSVIYLETMQSSGPIAIISSPGTRGELHSTAFGKVLLADFTDDEIERKLGPQPYVAKTPKTKTTFDLLIEDIRQVRKDGYAISDGENLANVFAVGVAIRDRTGRAVAAISGALPRSDMTEADRERLQDVIIAAAQRISIRLGAPLDAVLRHTGSSADQVKKETT